ncbi:helix-turn-helix domain-containing protein [Psychrobacter immobilis]|uniref:helix-turn-helix domain-containing protein n=1 Tax=Psychrobacter immobilis TaxID=498 RepID=UPI001918B0DF|nr:helix-turn-helix transcriptional regulator [Psychrobacter immobilis]
MANYIWSAQLNIVTGSLFRHMRTATGKGQKEVAEETSQLASTISKLESGASNITIEHIYSFCTLYKVSLSDFVELLEQATAELDKQRVLLYVDKSESTQIKDNSIVVKSRKVGTRTVVNASFFGLVRRYEEHDVYEDIPESKNVDDELELPKLSSKQVYSILKDFLDSLTVTIKIKDLNKSDADVS